MKKILKKEKKILAFSKLVCYYTEAPCERALYAPVAQLDRVTGYEPVGQGFESLPAYHMSTLTLIELAWTFFIIILDFTHKRGKNATFWEIARKVAFFRVNLGLIPRKLRVANRSLRVTNRGSRVTYSPLRVANRVSV